MIRYLAVVQRLLASFDESAVLRIPREQNAQDDALSKLASSSFEGLDRTVLIKVLLKPSTDLPETLYIEDGAHPDDWTTPIRKFLIKGKLPEDRAEARRIRVHSERFAMISETLFKRSYTTMIASYTRTICLRTCMGARHRPRARPWLFQAMRPLRSATIFTYAHN